MCNVGTWMLRFELKGHSKRLDCTVRGVVVSTAWFRTIAENVELRFLCLVWINPDLLSWCFLFLIFNFMR